MDNEKQRIQCLNCRAELSSKDLYCNNCGQKIEHSLLTVKDLLVDFLQNFLNLDNKLFKSLKQLIIPAKLAQTYFAGKKRSILSPFQLFFFSLFILLAIVTTTKRKTTSVENYINTRIGMALNEKKDLLYEIELNDDIQNEKLRDSIGIELFGELNDIRCNSFDQIGNISTVTFNFIDNQMTVGDALSMDREELFRKYEITNWGEKLIVNQFIRVFMNPGEMLLYFVGNIVWGLCLLIVIISAFQHILYFRKVYFFIEHAVLNIYNHCFLVLLCLLNYLLHLFEISSFLQNFLISFVLYGFYLIIARKIYYQQSWPMTTFKTMLSSFAYWLVQGIIVTATLLVSALLY